jgi:ABC-type spermidine/putrescine transport system permease subunit II
MAVLVAVLLVLPLMVALQEGLVYQGLEIMVEILWLPTMVPLVVVALVQLAQIKLVR